MASSERMFVQAIRHYGARHGIDLDVRSSSGQVWPLRLTRRPDGSLHVQLDNAD